MEAVENLSNDELFKLTNKFIDNLDNKENIDLGLDENILKEIHLILKDSAIIKTLNLFKNNSKIDYETLVELNDNLKTISDRITNIKEDIEIEKLYRSGEIYDFKKIRSLFESKSIFKKFPDFNWMKFKHWMKRPKTEIQNEKGHTIRIDRFLARKLSIAVMQMIGNEMDLWIMGCGKEGAGKSCLMSQIMLYLYNFLTEVGLIKYKFDLKKIIKPSLKTLLDDLDNTPTDSFFNMFNLDEGDDLDRMNFREEENKKFKSRMRRSRKNLNLVFVNSPQIGEIDTSVTLARMNFILYCNMKYDAKTALLDKGYAKFYILPRTDETYSEYYKKNLKSSYIQGIFSKQFERKIDYYKDLPNDILIKDIEFHDVWGFDKNIYDTFIKEENKKKSFEQGITLTKDQMYILFRYAPPLKDWYDKLRKEFIGVKSKDYEILKKLLAKIRKVFLEDKDLLASMENARKYK